MEPRTLCVISKCATSELYPSLPLLLLLENWGSSFSCLGLLGIEPMALHVLDKHFTTQLYPQPPLFFASFIRYVGYSILTVVCVYV